MINDSSNTNRNVSASQSAQVTGIEDQEVGNKLLSNITTTITRHSLSSLLMKSNSKDSWVHKELVNVIEFTRRKVQVAVQTRENNAYHQTQGMSIVISISESQQHNIKWQKLLSPHEVCKTMTGRQEQVLQKSKNLFRQNSFSRDWNSAPTWNPHISTFQHKMIRSTTVSTQWK